VGEKPVEVRLLSLAFFKAHMLFGDGFMSKAEGKERWIDAERQGR
jgi:hypothetical protein